MSLWERPWRCPRARAAAPGIQGIEGIEGIEGMEPGPPLPLCPHPRLGSSAGTLATGSTPGCGRSSREPQGGRLECCSPGMLLSQPAPLQIPSFREGWAALRGAEREARRCQPGQGGLPMAQIPLQSSWRAPGCGNQQENPVSVRLGAPDLHHGLSGLGCGRGPAVPPPCPCAPTVPCAPPAASLAVAAPGEGRSSRR